MENELEKIAQECIKHIKNNKPMDLWRWQEIVNMLEHGKYGSVCSIILDTYDSGVLIDCAKKMIALLDNKY